MDGRAIRTKVAISRVANSYVTCERQHKRYVPYIIRMHAQAIRSNHYIRVFPQIVFVESPTPLNMLSVPLLYDIVTYESHPPHPTCTGGMGVKLATDIQCSYWILHIS